MRKHILRFAAPFLVALLFSLTSYAQPSIAIVDLQALLTESNAAKNIQKQVEARRDEFLQELSKLEQELRKGEQELNAEQEKISKEDFAKKRQALEEKFMETRRLAQKRKKALDDGAAKALGKLRDEIIKVVGGIADEKSYGLVLSKQNVIIGDKSIDISTEAMERLNKNISQIALEIDAN